VKGRSHAALLLMGGIALGCRNEARSSGAAASAAAATGPSAPAASDAPGPGANPTPAALTAPAASPAPGDATDYGPLCNAFCSAAEAFQNGPPRACDSVDATCMSSCLATGKAIDARCGAAYREMYECFISSNLWSCGGSPSTPTPASCPEQQQRVELCLSVEPG
jgi:hypothetical protein